MPGCNMSCISIQKSGALSPLLYEYDPGGITARFDGLTGAKAALLLLDEMKRKISADGSENAPDIFTYTTVISGVVRAEVSLCSPEQVARD